jgi:hypothetical protein
MPTQFIYGFHIILIKTAIISLCNINQVIFEIETPYDIIVVRTTFLNITYMNFGRVRKVLRPAILIQVFFLFVCL